MNAKVLGGAAIGAVAGGAFGLGHDRMIPGALAGAALGAIAGAGAAKLLRKPPPKRTSAFVQNADNVSDDHVFENGVRVDRDGPTGDATEQGTRVFNHHVRIGRKGRELHRSSNSRIAHHGDDIFVNVRNQELDVVGRGMSTSYATTIHDAFHSDDVVDDIVSHAAQLGRTISPEHQDEIRGVLRRFDRKKKEASMRPYDLFLKTLEAEASTKSALGPDIAEAAMHFARGVGHNASGIATKVKNSVGRHVDDIKGRIAESTAERIAGQAAPHIQGLISPEGVGRMVEQPGVKNLIREHVAEAAVSPLDLLFGKRKTASVSACETRSYDLFMSQFELSKSASARNAAIDRHGFAPTGPVFAARERAPVGENVRETTQASTPISMAQATRYDEKQANALLKGLGGGFLLGAGGVAAADKLSDNKQKATADILRSKATYNRNRIRYQQTFQKLAPAAQREILKSYDAYAGSVAQGAEEGLYPVSGASLF